jgi:hypothetical protein
MFSGLEKDKLAGLLNLLCGWATLAKCRYSQHIFAK